MGKYSILVLLGLAFACGKKSTEETPADSFDRSAMLSDYADRIIAPALQDFAIKADSLYLTVSHFTASPSQESLDSAQAALRSAAVSWQYCSAFRYGPMLTQFGAIDVDPRQDYIFTFPANVAGIENFVANNYTSLTDVGFASRGLNAIDYLLNHLQDQDTVIINKFTASTARREFLKSLTLDIKSRASAANVGWQSFKGEFVANNGTSASSSSAELIKQFIVDFESFKNFEVGIPVGRVFATYSLDPATDKVAMYYAGNSLELLKHHFDAMENLWYGKNKAGIEGVGLKKYLESVEGGKETVAATINQFTAIRAKLYQIPGGRLSSTIQTNPQPVKDFYTEVLKMTHFLKSDMPSLLSIYITYASGDGD